MIEATLISKLKNDSYKAFNELYRMYSARVFAYSLQYVKSLDDADEVVQDVFVKLWSHRHDIRNEDNISAFLFVTARRMLINKFRKRLHSPLYEDFVDYLNDINTNDNDRLEYEDFVARLNTELMKLPDTQNRIIRLMKLDGLNIEKVCKRTGLKEQTVYNALSQGLKTLRENMKDISFVFYFFF